MVHCFLIERLRKSFWYYFFTLLCNEKVMFTLDLPFVFSIILILKTVWPKQNIKEYSSSYVSIYKEKSEHCERDIFMFWYARLLHANCPHRFFMYTHTNIFLNFHMFLCFYQASVLIQKLSKPTNHLIVTLRKWPCKWVYNTVLLLYTTFGVQYASFF